MVTNQSLAPLAALAFLGTAGLALLGSLYAAWRAIQSDGAGAGRALGGVCLLLAGYVTVLGLIGVVGRERVVPLGAEKYFCELDCHLAYSVTALDRVAAEGNDGRLWVLTLRTRFDETTISPRRPRDAPTWPAPMRAALVLAGGAVVGPLPDDDPVVAAQASGSVPWSQAIRPGESYQTRLVFRLPSDAVPARLLLEDDIPVSPLMIGNERSPFHRPVYLALPG